MDTFRYLQGFDQIKAELVVYKYPPVAAPNVQFVVGDNRAVHLPSLDVESLQDLWRISTVNIYVVRLVIQEEQSFSNRLNMLDLSIFYSVDVGWCRVLFMQVVKRPNVFQVLLPSNFVLILSKFLDFL